MIPGSDFTGEVVFGIWNLLTEKIEEVRSVNVQTAQGEASLLYDLAKFQFFSKDDVLFAVLHGKDGETVYTDIDFVDVETASGIWRCWTFGICGAG